MNESILREANESLLGILRVDCWKYPDKEGLDMRLVFLGKLRVAECHITEPITREKFIQGFNICLDDLEEYLKQGVLHDKTV